jgi:hypothetical protein
MLTEIRIASDSLNPHWSDEQLFWKLAKAVGGLFAFEYIVVRFIDDSTVGDPVYAFHGMANDVGHH